jgi:hypothetical protein
MQDKHHPGFPQEFIFSFLYGKQPPLPVPALWPFVILVDALNFTNEPPSLARKAASAYITTNDSLHTGLFSQLPASTSPSSVHHDKQGLAMHRLT